MTERALTDDIISTSFTVEELIVSDTVKVTLDITKVNSDSSFNLKKTLREMYDADWAIIKLSRYDDSGLERISATAVARIPENQTTIINSRLKEVSKAGLKIIVSGLDYSPERNKIEKTNESLRERIYVLAQKEADTLNRCVADMEFKWRVGSVDFNRQSDFITKSANYVTATALRDNDAEVEDATTTDFAHKVGLTAQVRLVRTLAY